MNKIRTTILTAAIAGGSIVGLAGVTGIADAATDTAPADAAALAIGEPGEADASIDDTTRAERHAARHAARQANRQAVADVLGVSVEELAEQLRGGATLADVAEANGVAVDDVVDVIMAQMTERIDQAVENGRFTAEEAAEKIADLEERVQTRVEEGRPERGDGFGRHGHRSHHNGETDTAADTAPDGDAEAEG